MKSNSKIKSLFTLSLLGIFLFSCENHVEEDAVPLEPTGQEELCNQDISFNAAIKPIIDTSCIECHGGTISPDLRTYQGISNNANRVRTQVVNRTMPRGGSLTNEQIELIRCWIDNGALNN